MTWFNVGDEEHSDPNLRDAGLDGFGLYAAAGSYCMNHLTEGFVPDWFVKGWPGGIKAAKKLIAVGIWARVEQGYRYIEWRQETREKVLARKAKWREDKRRQAANARAAKGVGTVDSNGQTATSNEATS